MYKSKLPELPGNYPNQVLVLLQSLIPSSVFVKDLSKEKLRVSYDAQAPWHWGLEPSSSLWGAPHIPPHCWWQGKRAGMHEGLTRENSQRLLSAWDPPAAIISRMEGICANFLWGSADGVNKHHWIAWSKLCRPTDEGGVGFRRL